LDFVEKFKKSSEFENPGTRLVANGDQQQSTISKRASTPTFSSARAQIGGDAIGEISALLLIYSSDLRNLERLICGDLFSKISDQCKIEDESSRRNLLQCLAETFLFLRGSVDRAIAEALVPWLTSQVSSQLASVVEVPRQYRWTRKEAPTHPSPYLSTALEPVRRLLQTSSVKLSDDTAFINGILERVFSSVVNSYTENLKSVFESVEKISSSLSRLKTKGASTGARTSGTPENVGAVTDEQKIRLQLRLDVEEFEKLVSGFSLPVICDLGEMKSLVTASVIGSEA